MMGRYCIQRFDSNKTVAASHRPMGVKKQSKFTTGMTAINQFLTPEQQKALSAQGSNLENMKKELDSVTQELTTIYLTEPAKRAVSSTPTL